MSAAVGAGIATGNLLGPHPGRDRAPARGGRRRSRAEHAGAGVVLALVKLGGLVAAVWLLLRYEWVAPLPTMLGLGALPIGIAIGSLVSDRSAGSEDR